MADEKLKFDFGGFATKHGIECADGKTIIRDAFKECDGRKVPLVWQHIHDTPNNILGHAILENREDGVYAYCKFNESEAGKTSKELVAHGDITSLSIYANSLKQKGKAVIHGIIREVSLVMAGANPGALIDNLFLAHSSDERDETEAIIYFDAPVDVESLVHKDPEPEPSKEPENKEEESIQHAAPAENATVQDILDTMDEAQKNVVYALVTKALSGEEGGEVQHSEEEGESSMKHNVFDQGTKPEEAHLTHDQMITIMNDAKKYGSLKDSVLAHASDYGIENIEVLFPDAQLVRTMPDMVKRDDSWVSGFLNGTYKTPFSRIKSMMSDLTEETARAKGYITGKRKKEEVFPVLKRTTGPTTVYKKQKLDREDIVDITDFDVVVWVKGEMRGLLDEELARAALLGDGREIDHEDKINELSIRPIWKDDEIFAPKVLLDEDISTLDFIDEVVRARKLYKGSGSPTLFTTEELITDMLLVRDLNQRRIYPTMNDLASALRVSSLVAVEVMEDLTRILPGSSDVVSLMGIMVNPKDYTIGADKGGKVTTFEDFDIDYNQEKYLMETRCSGALTKPKTAVVIEKRTAG